MPARCFLIYFVILLGKHGYAQTYEKSLILSICRRLGRFPKVFGQVKEWLIMELQKIIRLSHVVACPIVFFSEECSKLWKWSFFSVFNRLGPFPQVFRQVKEWLILELHKTIRVPHIVVCSIVFVLFYDRSCQGRVFKVMKNNYFLIFSVVCVPFPKFLGGLTNGFCSNYTK